MTYSPASRKQHAGFTLVEILLVVMIIAMATAAFASGSFRMYKKMSLDKAVRKFVLATKYARVYAIENQSECVLVLNASGQQDDEEQSGSGFFLAAVELDQQSGEEYEVTISNSYTSPMKFSTDVEFEAIEIVSTSNDDLDSDASFIVFRPDGTADSALITIGNSMKSYNVFIAAATGKAQVLNEDIEELPQVSVDLDLMEEEGE